MLTDLIDDMVTVPRNAEQRREIMDATVREWAPEERQKLSDDMSNLLTQRAVAVQTAALAAHERGEDVSAASAELQILVDLTVCVKMAVRTLAKDDDSED